MGVTSVLGFSFLYSLIYPGRLNIRTLHSRVAFLFWLGCLFFWEQVELDLSIIPMISCTQHMYQHMNLLFCLFANHDDSVRSLRENGAGLAAFPTQPRDFIIFLFPYI